LQNEINKNKKSEENRKVEHAAQLKLYNDNFIETIDRLGSLKKSYLILKSSSTKLLEYYKTANIEKWSKDVYDVMFNN